MKVEGPSKTTDTTFYSPTVTQSDKVLFSFILDKSLWFLSLSKFRDENISLIWIISSIEINNNKLIDLLISMISRITNNLKRKAIRPITLV